MEVRLAAAIRVAARAGALLAGARVPRGPLAFLAAPALADARLARATLVLALHRMSSSLAPTSNPRAGTALADGRAIGGEAMAMRTTLTAFLVAFALSPLAFAAALAGPPELTPAPPEAPPMVHQGRLTHIDQAERSFIIETAVGPEEFTLVEGGRVIGNGVETGFESLAVGQEVAVAAIQDDTDRWLAQTVEIVDPSAPAAAPGATR